ncbi:MAG: hypothetical protein A2W61_05960 [Deltaproteobacteria bacterium RIFCSPLOWO2_01_44_7]|nr:MAG: hypothetical protein A2712_06905 [Deltaproteobacteria bacterium RIFCSPHIGHO2_01_FULL_43_49]OGQ15677.1 MAG: hypothetical protein A3D22_05695 [Deltaproteobacteria bacterium RIFCSPHIGHO2_02_FULL_44_53]OGQ28646.1 MAG: hypothetical protein A3D98_00430 [Deltaproteobacteria bacterium RIFCSPHIGHO2_12_FULL_44_21]OGQ31968.1 MAG: hypothetical protein A2979_02635 [Deltaproteobacteria bacterium RIFCSPLOWO2_01_FULL_45_74]OGQ42311.1 MAG: hypothetical protein A2W61_05960 [Deltaproteobacteria bacterium 
MKQNNKIKVLTKEIVLALLPKIDHELAKQNKQIQVTLLGGVALLLQNFITRSTNDIDVFPNKDADYFEKVCRKLKIPVQIVALTSTVDSQNASVVNNYRGRFLTIDSIPAEDLIRSKLERFLKHDPDDIYAVIDHVQLPYEKFKAIVQEMLSYFIGNPRSLILSSQIVVERKYPQHLEDFKKTVKY